MSKLTKGSFWLSLFENFVYVAPTLITVLYYYFTELQYTTSTSSKWSFATAVTMFVLFCVYKVAAKNHLRKLEHKTNQTEADLECAKPSDTEQVEIYATNLKRYRMELDAVRRVNVLIVLLIIALAVYIIEQATLGLTNLCFIAVASVAAGSGIHVGVISLMSKEACKDKEKQNEQRNEKS